MYRFLNSFDFKIIKRPIKKLYTIIRDNTIVFYLNKFGCTTTAQAYNYLTTSTNDIIILGVCAKLGITSIQSKYIILIILSFLL